MDIAVLGTGVVGRTISAKLGELGHRVALGTRDVAQLRERGDGDERMSSWLDAHPAVTPLPFAEAAATGEVVFNATSGVASLDVLHSAGAGNLAGKALLDVANPLDFSQGFPPTLSVCNDDSLAEQIQRAFPSARVVKTLNTVTAAVMVDPGLVGNGEHQMFVAGDDADAKATATEILTEWFGWRHVLDLGGLTAARGMEMWLALWVRLMAAQGTPMFNLALVR